MSLAELPLLDFIPAISPHMRRPEHLGDWARMIERTTEPVVDHKPIRGMCAYATRHWKTKATLHGVIQIVMRRPTWRVLLIANDNDRALWLGTQTQVLRDRAGLKAKSGQDTKKIWATEQGGGVTVMSREQSAIGYDANVVIADDLLDENGFQDPLIRNQADEVLNFYASRAGGDGALGAVLLVMSRGDRDDPFGRRLGRKAADWGAFSAPAILDEGLSTERAFAPAVWSLDALKAKRAEMAEIDPALRTWHSQWMCDPLAFAEGFFEGHTPYLGAMPPADAAILCGLDCAFTQGKKSDYFAAVLTCEVGGKLVVFRVIRHRRGLSEALQTLLELHAMYPNIRFFSYTSGPEIGIYHDLFERSGGQIIVECMQARWNKATRSGKSAEAWRARRIEVMLGQPWTGIFLGELHSFNGGEIGIDDQVDALVSAHDAWALGRPHDAFGSTFTFGRACM